MATTPQNPYDIPAGGYMAFDAMSLRQLIIDRLNEQGTFTDQNFVGSNLASIIDIVAYSYNTLIYYLNKTSTESMFSEAQLYENMNRIVKLIDYKPIGYQTSTLTFNASANSSNGLDIGLYTIPRYSSIKTSNIAFSFTQDVTFAKTNNSNELLTQLSQDVFLYQGSYQEYPTYTAAGDDNEIVLLDTAGVLVDHFNIDVYVYSNLNGTWSQYTPTNSLYLETGTAKKYEIRLNENQRYEIKFGNDINGLKLRSGDLVAVYYLQSDGTSGIVGPLSFNGSNGIVKLNTPQFKNILSDIVGNQYNFLTDTQISQNIFITNNSSSTNIRASQTTDNIRDIAPSNFRSQYRLVTTKDFQTFIQTNFANLITDVRVVNNTDYVSQYLQYFYKLGVNNPNLTDRALINQVLYADSCNFNNIYLVVAPRATNTTFNYLAPAQKQLIKSSLSDTALTTAEIVFIDPVYKAVSIGIANPGKLLYPAGDQSCIQLQVKQLPNSLRNKQAIANDILNIFTNYFSNLRLSLGMTLDVRGLTQEILAVDGVQTFYTARTDVPDVKVEGLSIYVWNPNYPYQDAISTSNNVSLNYFEFPYYNNLNNITNYIVIN
jgi:hypothetical protein